MHRYTAKKSNVYATSTNAAQQQMVHCHMTCHYRMLYNAKSKVDSSAPRHYKGRFAMSDCSRKKSNKYPIRSNRTKTSHRTEMDLQNQLLIDRILYDTKLPPSAYFDECVSHRQYSLSEPAKEVRNGESDRTSPKEFYQCQNIDIVPSLTILPNCPTQKVRQSPQFRDFVSPQWNKKVTVGNKRNTSLVKHLENPQDVVRNNIPRQGSRPRLYHSSHSRRTTCVSSGSEGNAGDDEDGAPTSSYDESNPSDNEKLKLSGRKVPVPDSGSLLKTSMKKRLGEACLCIPTAGETKKFPASEISSRDSAYEGGEGMSSTEKERTSPDHIDDRICQCTGMHYGTGSKADNMSESMLQEEKPQIHFKSELYMKFLQDVTDDILVQGVYTNEGLERLFKEHIKNNVYNLDKEHLGVMIEKLAEDLGMPVNHWREDKLFDESSIQNSDLSDEKRSRETIWPHIKAGNFSVKANDVVGVHFTPKSVKGNEVSLVHRPWDKKQFPNRELKNSSAVVIIEQNFSMSKKDILHNLTELGFDKSMAEEIYHILAGKDGTYPDFTLKELQEIIQQ